jgi:cobalt-zinc-cadmium efflux system outer membrane protein
MRRRWLFAPLVLAAGCATTADRVPCLIEQEIQSVAPARVEYVVGHIDEAEPLATPSDLPGLWQLALAHNPALREAAAEVELARGRLIQAGTYPNPKVAYHGEGLGSHLQSKGNNTVELSQEIVTAGKRRLDRDAAGRALDAAATALLGRKLDELARVRRAWYDYQSLLRARQVNRDTVKGLEEGVEGTRHLVEDVKSHPFYQLLRLQVLLEQAKINLARSETNVAAAWQQVAAEVGVPDLPPPPSSPALPDAPPQWSAELVKQRVLSANTDLTLAALETDRARLAFERARAEAVPNVTVGVGYNRLFLEETAGVALTLETPIPVWDRRQGLIHEKRARWAQAEAAERSVAGRLSRDIAEAFARYEGARIQVDRLKKVIVPKLEQNLKLVRSGFYEAGAKDLTFLDVQTAVQTLAEARARLADAHRELWKAVADLEGLMQLELGEEP